MGYGSWDSDAYSVRSVAYASQTREQIFESHSVNKEYDPKLIKTRESRDSEESPESTPLIFALDVTGSMGFIAEHIAKKGLGSLVKGILDTQPVTNPHMLIMALGDIRYDEAPLQVTQFEVDAVDEQLTELYLEGGGGGNNTESYDLPWLFAARKTSTDAWEKRQKKGYLFTIGDEEFPSAVSPAIIYREIGIDIAQKSTATDFLAEAQEKYHVFHVIVEEGNHYSYAGQETLSSWRAKLAKKVILLSDHRYISEVIISVMRVNEGEHPEEVIKSWQTEEARETVRHALFN